MMTNKPLQKTDLEFDELYEEAEASIIELETAGENIVSALRQQHPQTFDDIKFELGKVKDKSGARKKAEFLGSHHHVHDIIRARIVVSNAEQVDALRKIFNDNMQKFSIKKIKDRFAVPNATHFRDINMSIKLPSGHLAELRIEQKDILEISEKTHEIYKKAKDIKYKAKEKGVSERDVVSFQTLIARVQKMTDLAAHASGINKLLSDKGSEILRCDREKRALLKQHIYNMLPNEFNYGTTPLEAVELIEHKRLIEATKSKEAQDEYDNYYKDLLLSGGISAVVDFVYSLPQKPKAALPDELKEAFHDCTIRKAPPPRHTRKSNRQYGCE